jgi:hypothetical protein
MEERSVTYDGDEKYMQHLGLKTGEESCVCVYVAVGGGLSRLRLENYVKFEVFGAVTMKNAVFSI